MTSSSAPTLIAIPASLLFLPLAALAGSAAPPPGPLVTAASLAVAPTIARTFTNHRLEPKSSIILHGAGQSDETSFAAYTAALTTTPPMLTMSYIDLSANIPAYFTRLRAELARYPTLLIPQIGLSMVPEGSTHNEAAVAAGTLDPALLQLCDGLRSLDRPVFLRIGYEFNGPWNAYHPQPYIAAYRRVVTALRTAKLENVATVWDWSADADLQAEAHGLTAAEARTRRDSFYPGDDWVDWWGLNLFSTAGITAPETQTFLADAVTHHFPVMIGEATPQGHSVSEGISIIAGWYAPFFGLLRSSPQIKAISYIDWDWSRYPQWADWGDARIERNPQVLAFVQQQLAAPLFAHAADRKRTLKLLRAR